MSWLKHLSPNKMIPWLICIPVFFCVPGGLTCQFQAGDAALIHPGFTYEHIRPAKDHAILKVRGELANGTTMSMEICWLRALKPEDWIKVLLSSGYVLNSPDLGEPVYAASVRNEKEFKSIRAWLIYQDRFALHIRCHGEKIAYPDLLAQWKDLAERTRRFLDMRCPEENPKPLIRLDRTEGAPGSPLLLKEASHFKKDVNAQLTWDGLIIEDNIRISDDTLEFATMPGKEEVEIRKHPWLWVYIPRDATPGKHKLQAEQRDAGVFSNTIEITVKAMSNYELATDFDDLLGLYGDEVPNNPRSRHGSEWNIFNMFSGPEFKCGDYQARVIRFCSELLFSDDIRRRKLMDGFDFGPLVSGADIIRFTHHFVVIWPRGRDWHERGVFLDPWLSQRPRAFVVNPGSSDPWWLNCDWYKPEEPDSFFVDRPAYKDFLSTPRADDLVYGGPAGMGFPTHTLGRFHYEDIINTKKKPPEIYSTGLRFPRSG